MSVRAKKSRRGWGELYNKLKRHVSGLETLCASHSGCVLAIPHKDLAVL